MDEENKAKVALHFLSIAESLKDLADKMKTANEGGEPVDVFESFQEAINIMAKPQDIPDTRPNEPIFHIGMTDVQEVDDVQ